MAKTLAERLRDCAQGVRLGANGMGWSPDPALLEEAANKIVSLHAELQHARDGLTKGRTRMREDNERLAREAYTWSKAAETYAKQAQRQPLTRQQIDDVMTQHYPLSSLLREEVDAFEACVRDIERLHGIGA